MCVFLLFASYCSFVYSGDCLFVCFQRWLDPLKTLKKQIRGKQCLRLNISTFVGGRNWVDLSLWRRNLSHACSELSIKPWFYLQPPHRTFSTSGLNSTSPTPANYKRSTPGTFSDWERGLFLEASNGTRVCQQHTGLGGDRAWEVLHLCLRWHPMPGKRNKA